MSTSEFPAGVKAAIRVYSDWDVYPPGSIPPLVERATGFVRVDDIARADCALLPQTEWFEEHPVKGLQARWGLGQEQATAAKTAYARLKDEAQARDITVIAVTHSDFDWQNPISNSITFQTNLRRSTRRERDFTLAGFSFSDLAPAEDGKLVPFSEWKASPSVGFQGSSRLTDRSAERYGRDMATWLAERTRLGGAVLGRVKWSDGQLLRAEAMAALQRDGVECDFRLITRGWHRASTEKREVNRRTFIDNLLRNPYALCVRGRGNFSYRLYEAMSLRRIPVLVDTECVLPFDHLVDWPSEMVWVDQSRVGDTAAILRTFHDQHKGSSLELAQGRIRELFETWCRPESFWPRAGELVAACL